MKGKLSMRRAWVGFWVVLCVLLVGACGKATSSSGSNSNWLQACDTAADCRDGSECWCHVCAAPCTGKNACDQAGATCQAGTSRGCGESAVSASICLAACKTSADCRSFGSSFSCVNAACVVATTSTPGAGGSGGAGATTLQEADVGVLAVGLGQRCLTSNDRVYCWGANMHGEAGGDPLRDSPGAHLLPELSNVVELAASSYHTCARTSGGDVYCWGFNASGEIGAESAAKGTCPDQVLDKPGDFPCQPTPTRVAAVSGAVQIAVADGRSCAVLADGSIKCWGDVADISTWVAASTAPGGLALGPSGACAITPMGVLSCSAEPSADVTTLHDLQTIVLGSRMGDAPFGCALGSAGDVHCWGADGYGQLGEPNAADRLTNPVVGATSIAATGSGACTLSGDGSVWCWGRNSDGEAGLAPQASPTCGTETCETAPQRVQDLPKATKLAAGGVLACAVVEDGGVWCWGGDSFRTAGTPQRVPGPWEGGEAACVTRATGARQALNDVFVMNNTHGCKTDQDCTSVSLDLPCLHSCESVPLAKEDSATIAAAIADVGRSYCDAAPASCAAHEVSCAPSSDVDACFAGTCMRVNLAKSGCSDPCSCMAERAAANGVYQGDCAGPDLWVMVSMDCSSCGAGGAWLVVGNRGDTEFSGPATLSFEPENPDEQPLVPAAQSLALTLAPGEVTKPIYVESRGQVATRPRITGMGDCEPRNDNSNGVTFPAAQSCP